ncbi:DUF4867 family protein [Priestia megaterium]|jgi:hypothetical protein|nr:DUF4867 family protein [Priestia megaterium]KOP77583.1 hypothetical protein AMS61_15620 [Bacillus sp. FJAT-21351]MBG9933668.1 hypothetical protein [Priestia aryabhattai]MCJ7985206.1 DUF4867 family protein [Priestia sp. OVL9]ANF48978.1 hypothetical protein AZK53_17265 [Priestia megaterium]AQU76670.1 DUF4867 domain-containing protein [Priestia megaterium]
MKDLNKHIPFYHIEDSKFKHYGKVINEYDFNELETYMDSLTIPQDQNVYVASVTEMENTIIKNQLQEAFYGEMSIQIGYCNGPNSTLNGLEYHKSSEINIAITDMVLLLGKVQEVENNVFHSNDVIAFFVPKGTAVELYSTTLHFAPCKVNNEGFKTIVILPKGTNDPLSTNIQKRTKEDELLFMKNKWLIAHPEREQLINKGAHPGIKGENIKVYQ